MADPLLPPLLRMRQSDKPVSTIRLIAFLDKANPLTESRWVRTGEPDAWSLQSTASKGGVPESAWAGKIHVADPDPVCPLSSRHVWTLLTLLLPFLLIFLFTHAAPQFYGNSTGLG